MNLQLTGLFIRNFKGIKQFELRAAGQSLKVFGENEAGKTSLFDAFTWLFFGKNSQGKKEFNIKPLDKDNNPIHHLEYEVEGHFTLDGQPISFKRQMVEDWPKKVFKGNTTNYFINDVPVLLKDYKAKIEGIIDESKFKLLTDALYFNTQLKWTERQALLMSNVPNTTPEQVAAAAKLDNFFERLEGRTVSEQKTVLREKHKKLKKIQDAFKARYDENSRSLKTEPAESREDINTSIQDCDNTLKDLNKQLNDVAEQNKARDEQQEKVREAENNLSLIKDALYEAASQAVKDASSRLFRAQAEMNQIDSDITRYERHISELEKDIENYNDAVKAAAEQYKTAKASVYQEPERDGDQFKCLHCGQSLQSSEVDSIIEKQRTEFNTNRSTTMSKAQQTAGEKQVLITNAKQSIEDNIGTLSNLRSRKAILDKDITVLKKESQASVIVDYDSNDNYVKARNKVNLAKGRVQEIVSSESINDLITGIRNNKADFVEKLGIYKHNEQIETRRAEIESEEKTNSELMLQIESQLDDIKAYERTEVELIQGPIDALFKTLKVRMFKQLVNGDYESTCDILIPNKETGSLVPYNDANSAAQINAGLEIINVLSEQYDFVAPIFIDKNESVTKLIETRAQTIGLYVEEGATQLRVEKH